MKTRILIIITLCITLFFVGGKRVYATTTNPVWDMSGWWWLDDDPSTTDAEDNTGYGVGDAAQETNITGLARSTNVRLRIDVEETANQTTKTDLSVQLEYMSGDVTCTDGGTWTTITTSSANAFQLIDTANITDGASASTNRILGEAMTFLGDGVLLDQTNPTIAYRLDAKSSEIEWNFQATSNASYEQVYTFRVSSVGTAFNNYSLPTPNDCPTATIESAPSATYTQNKFEWFVSADSVTLTDAWPSGAYDLGEDAFLTQIPVANDALGLADQIRMQMNFQVTGSALSATTQAFQLEFDAADDCTAASGWATVGAKSATDKAWRLFDEASIGDSTTQVNNISDSSAGAEGYYSEINASGTNPNAVGLNEYSEWDWPVENYSASENTTYCFRMAKSGGTALDNYTSTSYPKLTTVPGMSNLLRHGNIFSGGSERGYYWAD